MDPRKRSILSILGRVGSALVLVLLYSRDSKVHIVNNLVWCAVSKFQAQTFEDSETDEPAGSWHSMFEI